MNEDLQPIIDKIINALIGCTVTEAEQILKAVGKQLKYQAVIEEAQD